MGQAGDFLAGPHLEDQKLLPAHGCDTPPVWRDGREAQTIRALELLRPQEVSRGHAPGAHSAVAAGGEHSLSVWCKCGIGEPGVAEAGRTQAGNGAGRQRVAVGVGADLFRPFAIVPGGPLCRLCQVRGQWLPEHGAMRQHAPTRNQDAHCQEQSDRFAC